MSSSSPIFTPEGYDKLQQVIQKQGLAQMTVPIRKIFYQVLIDENECTIYMPIFGNEMYAMQGFKFTNVTTKYNSIEELNECLDITPCPYHWFGTHDICPADVIKTDEYETCSICLESSPLTQLVPLACNHVFHKQCLNGLCTIPRELIKCPMCRRPVYHEDL